MVKTNDTIVTTEQIYKYFSDCTNDNHCPIQEGQEEPDCSNISCYTCARKHLDAYILNGRFKDETDRRGQSD
jgi:hypothetical protein